MMQFLQKENNRSIYIYEKKDVPLRDLLAIDRTILANERTFLAWVRTSLSLIVSGITFVKYLNIKILLIIGYVFIPLGSILLVLGTLRFLKGRKELRDYRKLL